MGKHVIVEKDKESGELFVDLNTVLEGTNVKAEDVDRYEITEENGNITIRFFDKNGGIIKVREEKQ